MLASRNQFEGLCYLLKWHYTGLTYHPLKQNRMPPPYTESNEFNLLCFSSLIQVWHKAKILKVSPLRSISLDLFQNHTTHTTPEKSLSQAIQSLHLSCIYEHTETKSLECIYKEEERSEGSESPENPTSAAYRFKSQNWALMIDRGARLLFPLSYSAFTIAYFVMII